VVFVKYLKNPAFLSAFWQLLCCCMTVDSVWRCEYHHIYSYDYSWLSHDDVHPLQNLQIKKCHVQWFTDLKVFSCRIPTSSCHFNSLIPNLSLFSIFNVKSKLRFFSCRFLCCGFPKRRDHEFTTWQNWFFTLGRGWDNASAGNRLQGRMQQSYGLTSIWLWILPRTFFMNILCLFRFCRRQFDKILP